MDFHAKADRSSFESGRYPFLAGTALLAVPDGFGAFLAAIFLATTLATIFLASGFFAIFLKPF